MLEWGIKLALMDCLFQDNKLKPEVTDRKCSQQLARSLRNRFYFFGILGLILSPFLFVGVLVYFFFKYGEQVRLPMRSLLTIQIKNKPGEILGLRNWSSIALWKFRDYNELPHVFQKRVNKVSNCCKPLTRL